jgi:hypothetical protein
MTVTTPIPAVAKRTQARCDRPPPRSLGTEEAAAAGRPAWPGGSDAVYQVSYAVPSRPLPVALLRTSPTLCPPVVSVW